MSKKKMLEEAQVRRMFELAGMPAIGDGFIGGKYAKLAEEEEEEEKDELEEAEDCPHCNGDAPKSECIHNAKNEGSMKYSREEEGEEAMADEAPAEEPEMEMGAEEAPEMAMDAAPSSDIPQEKIEAIVDAVLAGIEQETGVPLERVPEEGAEAPAEEAPAEEAPAEEGPEMAMGGEEEEEDISLENRIVQEVSRRVARRLIQITKKK
jgi:hypothetical protein